VINGFLVIFLFFVVIVITLALFSGWVLYSIARLAFGGIARLIGMSGGGGAARTLASAPIDVVKCARSGCCAMNPDTARFCRRCGAELPAPQRVMVRRAAVW
jgi:hypothetical protein